MLIASKYEDIYPPALSDLVYMTADSYTSEEIQKMEREILGKLEFKLGSAGPLVFLRRLSRLAKVSKKC